MKTTAASALPDAQLRGFRALAAAMTTEPTNWEWIGKHASQRMFGITEQRATDYATTYGGNARQMKED